MIYHMMCHMNTFSNISCSFVNYSLQQTQEFLKSETFPDTELQDKVYMYVPNKGRPGGRPGVDPLYMCVYTMYIVMYM